MITLTFAMLVAASKFNWSTTSQCSIIIPLSMLWRSANLMFT